MFDSFVTILCFMYCDIIVLIFCIHSSHCIYVFFVTVTYALIWKVYCIFLYHLVTNPASSRCVEHCMDFMNDMILYKQYNTYNNNSYGTSATLIDDNYYTGGGDPKVTGLQIWRAN